MRVAALSIHFRPMDARSLSSLEYFAALVADDDSLSLTEAAAAIAQVGEPELDLQAVLTDLDTLAWRLRQRLPADAAPLQRVQALHHYLYKDLGFSAGEVDDPACSHLNRVLQQRRGIPVAMAVIYLELAGQIGLQADGLAFPGHFMVKLHLPLGEAVIDPLSGRSLSRQDLEARLEPYLDPDAVGRLGLEAASGALGELLAEHLQPASARDILARMLRNLERAHRASGDLLQLLQIQHRQVTLEPEVWTWRRERGQTLAQLGLTEEAIEDLQCYLDHAGRSSDRRRISAQLAALREAGPPRWH
ncbi:MAG: hypothetical protein QG612_1848 [Pseudomonadota bacterium]|nr:hypothetical protein [Pseudomonadota bacterium]